MSHLLRRVTFIAAALVLASTLLAEAGRDRYAAVAFSPSTGLYGYGNGYATKDEAIEKAVQECGGRDAITRWARNSWLALAISDRTSAGYGWGSGWAETASEAREIARDKCLEKNDEARVVVCISAYR